MMNRINMIDNARSLRVCRGEPVCSPDHQGRHIGLPLPPPFGGSPPCALTPAVSPKNNAGFQPGDHETKTETKAV
jgi:hypothetical protein